VFVVCVFTVCVVFEFCLSGVSSLFAVFVCVCVWYICFCVVFLFVVLCFVLRFIWILSVLVCSCGVCVWHVRCV